MAVSLSTVDTAIHHGSRPSQIPHNAEREATPSPQLIQNSRIKPLPLTAITANCRLSRGFLRKCSAQVCNLEPCQVMIRHVTLFLIGYLAKCACNRFKIGITECRSLVRRACQTAEQCLHCKTEHTLVFVWYQSSNDTLLTKITTKFTLGLHSSLLLFINLWVVYFEMIGIDRGVLFFILCSSDLSKSIKMCSWLIEI